MIPRLPSWPWLLAALLALSLTASVGLGAVRIGPWQIAGILVKPLGVNLPAAAFTPVQEAVFWHLRLPRALLAAGVGAGLAAAGAATQGLFRNPLAEPGLLGVSGGAALGAMGVIVLVPAAVLGPHLPRPLALAGGAFAGGLAATALVRALAATRDGHGDPGVTALLLAGIALNSLVGAAGGLLAFAATDTQLRDLTFWTLGSFSGAGWPVLGAVAAVGVGPLLVLGREARALNALLLGENEAAHLGFDLARTKRRLIIAVALLVGAAVSAAGIIGFVGLVVPHLFRLWRGPDHRALLPGATLLGAALLPAADLICRTVAAPAELPVGAITALLGAPFFLWLLRRAQRGESSP